MVLNTEAGQVTVKRNWPLGFQVMRGHCTQWDRDKYHLHFKHRERETEIETETEKQGLYNLSCAHTGIVVKIGTVLVSLVPQM